ncbi:MAG: methyltransferase domain-containing protein [Hyphomicrobiaceae bacterium]
MRWIEYWDDKPTIYVGARHRDAHYRCVAEGLVSCLQPGDAVVLDYGCGEALNAGIVASRLRRLYLCDAAPSVRAELSRRFAGNPAVTVVAPEELSGIAEGSIDLVVANSVIQYLSAEVLDGCLDDWKRLVQPRGRIVLADVIPRGVGPLTDAAALLRFAAREGFLLAAVAGLVRTFFSPYRTIRAKLGLTQLDEAEVIAMLAGKGLAATRVHPNLGHNQARMAFEARPR